MRALYICGFTALVALVACDDLSDQLTGRRQGTQDPGGAAGAAAAEASAPVAEGGLRVLTQTEYDQTVHDLFGADIAVPKLTHDTRIHGWTTVGARTSAIPAKATEEFETAALEIAKQALSASKRTATAGCVPTGAPGDECVTKFVETWGRRIFRRPLTAEESAPYRTLAEETAKDLGDPWGGLEFVLVAMLESPSFTYRLDTSEPDGASAQLRFTSYTMASRLSYLLWSSTPDDELLDAAGRGELSTIDGVRAAATRLLANEKSGRGLMRFFNEWLDVTELDHLEKNTSVYPEFTPSLRAAMREQIERTIKDVVFDRDGDFLELFDTREIFMNGELAPLYGMSAGGSGFSKVKLDGSQPRAGLLGWAGVLALESRPYASSPTIRGEFVLSRLLCQNVAPPPPDATQKQPQEIDGRPLTTRERAEARMSNPACSGCHLRLDGIGLGLENFDAIGRYRTAEDSVPINASGTLDSKPFNGAVELATQLRSNPRVVACAAQNILSYAIGQSDNSSQFRAQAEEARVAFTGTGQRIRATFQKLVESDAFRRPVVTGGK